MLTRNGDIAAAEAIAQELARLSPKDTLAQGVRLPTIRAAVELQRGNAAAAIESLRGVRQYELGEGFDTRYVEPFTFVPMYLRGYAYLRTGAAAEAAAEFQKVIDHRGLEPTSPLYPLAYVGLARAYAQSNDREKSRRAYEAFLALWKNADSDIPILKRAKAEYAQLRKP